MGEIVSKRWFQVISVIFLLTGFLIAMYVMRSRKTPVSSDNTVADVCGAKISRLEYQTAISRRTTRVYYRERQVRASDREKIHIAVFKEIVNDKRLEKMAEKLNVVVTEKDIDAKINKMKSQINPPQRREEMFTMYRQSMGYQSDEDMREDIKYEIMESKLTEKKFPHAKYKIGEKELSENIPTLKLTQIFLTMNPAERNAENINNSYDKMKDRANQIYKKVMAGEDFKELAVKFSQDKNVAKTRGAIGWVSQNMVAADFWDVVSTLEPGQVSVPFKTKAGLHIVKCEELIRPGDRKYDEMKGVFTAGLILRKQKRDFAGWFASELTQMEEKDCIKIFDHTLLANKYVFMGKVDKAIEEYNLAIKEDPEFPYYHVDIGQLYAKQGKKAEALAEYRKATEIAPMDGALYFAIGEAYMGYGEHEKALREFQKASDLSRLDYEIHLRLQAIYAQLGLLAEADEEHDRYLKAMEVRSGGAKEGSGEEQTGAMERAAPEMPDYGGAPEEPTQNLPLREPGLR